MPLTYWRQLKTELGGTRAALLYAANRLISRLSFGRLYVAPYGLYAQPVPSPALGRMKPDAATVVRRYGPQDALPEGLPRPAAEMAERQASGAECHVCWVQGELAGFIWLRAGWHEEHLAGCRYLIPDDAVWDFDVYVTPRFRLGKTFARMRAAVDADLEQRGVRWSMSNISRFNRTSIGTHVRLGAQLVGQVTFLRLGRWQLAWLPGKWLPQLGRHAGDLRLHAPQG